MYGRDHSSLYGAGLERCKCLFLISGVSFSCHRAAGTSNPLIPYFGGVYKKKSQPLGQAGSRDTASDSATVVREFRGTGRGLLTRAYSTCHLLALAETKSNSLSVAIFLPTRQVMQIMAAMDACRTRHLAKPGAIQSRSRMQRERIVIPVRIPLPCCTFTSPLTQRGHPVCGKRGVIVNAFL